MCVGAWRPCTLAPSLGRISQRTRNRDSPERQRGAPGGAFVFRLCVPGRTDHYQMHWPASAMGPSPRRDPTGESPQNRPALRNARRSGCLPRLRPFAGGERHCGGIPTSRASGGREQPGCPCWRGRPWLDRELAGSSRSEAVRSILASSQKDLEYQPDESMNARRISSWPA
jgi:hypothetical protein